MKISDIRPEVYGMAERAQERIKGRFKDIDAVAEVNTRRVMEAFQDNRVAEACFAGMPLPPDPEQKIQHNGDERNRSGGPQLEAQQNPGWNR